MFFPTVAHAMGTGGAGAAGDPMQGLGAFVPLLAMFGIFYFLLIRPQQRRAKEHKAMLEALKRGDEVVTQGGILGKVTGIADDVVTVEVAQDVKVRVQRAAIASVKRSG